MEVEEAAALAVIADFEREACSMRDKLHMLEQYYESRFPFEQLFNWIQCRTPAEDRCKREVSYLARKPTDIEEEFCIRNRGYADAAAFAADARRIVPLRIDIGPQFNFHPSETRKTPVRREFVIDIDMSDYDNLRTCCSGRVLRRCCWPFMVAAYDVLKALLAECFGFTQVLWVFSGRRGIHAWVCDEAAMRMANPIRKAVTNFLNFSVTNEHSNSLVKEELLRKAHYRPLERVYELLSPYKTFLLEEQRVLQKPEIFDRVLRIAERYCRGPIGPRVREELSAVRTPGEQFRALLRLVEEGGEGNARRFELEFIIGFLYPKIDANVSAEMGHLLKAPFNVHMDTLKVSVPLDDVRTFDPENCLTLEDVLLRGGVRGGQSFDGYLRFFDDFVEKLKAASNS